MATLKSRIDSTVGMLLSLGETVPVRGCVTGSCLMDADFDAWADVPDVDVFCYTTESMAALTAWLMGNGWELGADKCRNSAKAEAWKVDRLMSVGSSSKVPVTTTYLQRDGVGINVTYKKNCRKLVNVLASFDMTCICKGVDIQSGFELDLRGDPAVAWPNPLRMIDQDMSGYSIDGWLRQWDRVLKYWQRGINTMPMAVFYLGAIDKYIETGSIFASEKSQAQFEKFAEDFLEMRVRIQRWVDQKAEAGVECPPRPTKGGMSWS